MWRHAKRLRLDFFYVVPSSEETSLWPPSMVYISVISDTYYTLHIMLDLLCGQLYMYCTLDTSSPGIWVLMMQFLSFCGLESHTSPVSVCHKWAAMVYHVKLFIDPHYEGIQIQINNSFLFRINSYLPCQDLNLGPLCTKQIAYQCATVLWLRLDLYLNKGEMER